MNLNELASLIQRYLHDERPEGIGAVGVISIEGEKRTVAVTDGANLFKITVEEL